jgi:hypothetical protein
MRTTRPAEFSKEWDVDGDRSWGYCNLHPKKIRCHASIHADFDLRSVATMRAFARWLTRAADYMEKHRD